MALKWTSAALAIARRLKNALADPAVRQQFLDEARRFNLEICSLAMSGFYAQSFAERPTVPRMVQDCIDTMKAMNVKVAFLPLGVRSDLVKHPELRSNVVEHPEGIVAHRPGFHKIRSGEALIELYRNSAPLRPGPSSTVGNAQGAFQWLLLTSEPVRQKKWRSRFPGLACIVSRLRRRLESVVAHFAHAAAVTRRRTFLFLLRNLSDETFRGQEQARD